MKYSIFYKDSYGSENEVFCDYWKHEGVGIMYCIASDNPVDEPIKNWGFVPHSQLIAILINTDESPTSETTA